MATTPVATQGTAQKLEDDPHLPLDSQSNLVYVLTRLFRLIAQVVNPMLAKLAGVTVNSDSNGGISIGPGTDGKSQSLILDYATGGYAQIYSRRNHVIRWVNLLGYESTVYPETGGNAGSHWLLTRYNDDASAGYPAVFVSRKTGVMKLGAGATTDGYSTNAATLELSKATGADYCTVIGSTNGAARWAIKLGDADGGETGSNAGSNCNFQRYSDSGAYLGNPISIRRSDGFISFNDTAGIATNNAPISTYNGAIFGANGMALRWDGANSNFLWMGSGANAWSWQWNRQNGTLAWLNSASAAVFQIDGSGNISAATLNASSTAGVAVSGVGSDSGNTYSYQDLVTGNPAWSWDALRSWHQHGIWAGMRFQSTANNVDFVLSNAAGWGAVNAAAFNVQSDATTKTAIQPVADALALIEGIQAHTYEFIPTGRTAGAPEDVPLGPTYGKTRWCGTMAQEWVKRLPEAVTDSGEGGNLMLDYAAIGAVTAQAVSELLARVSTLETRIAALEAA